MARIGKYEVIREVGKGGMGRVYLAHDLSLGRKVALKLLLENSDKNALERFKQEIQAMASLSHPNIVKIYEAGIENFRNYFVMDFIEGKTLKTILQEKKLPISKVVEIMVKVADAVEYAHKNNILHRDLKPDNIMLNHEENPIVMDFGLAKELDKESRVSETGEAIGTPAYMAPEQAKGNKVRIDHVSDVYALGAVLYELLTNSPPFQGTQHSILLQIVDRDPTKPTKISKRIPRDLENICLKAMEKKKILRYQSARELKQDLERFIEGKTVFAGREKAHVKIGRFLKRNRFFFLSLFFLCFFGILVLGFMKIRKLEDDLKKAKLKYDILSSNLQDTFRLEKRELLMIIALKNRLINEESEKDLKKKLSFHTNIIKREQKIQFPIYKEVSYIWRGILYRDLGEKAKNTKRAKAFFKKANDDFSKSLKIRKTVWAYIEKAILHIMFTHNLNELITSAQKGLSLKPSKHYTFLFNYALAYAYFKKKQYGRVNTYARLMRKERSDVKEGYWFLILVRRVQKGKNAMLQLERRIRRKRLGFQFSIQLFKQLGHPLANQLVNRHLRKR